MYITLYQYYFQDPVTTLPRDEVLQDFIMTQESQRFLTLYAKKFAGVVIPEDSQGCVWLGTRQARKIGKAMLSHEKTDDFRDTCTLKEELGKDQYDLYDNPKDIHRVFRYTTRREQIAKDLGCKVSKSEIDVLWRLTDLFLFGGEVWIQGRTSKEEPPRDRGSTFLTMTHVGSHQKDYIRSKVHRY